MKKNIFQKSIFYLFFFTIYLVLLILSCSKEKIPSPSIALNDYLLNLPAWGTFSKNEGDTTLQDEPEKTIDWDERKVRERTHCSITKTPDKIVTMGAGANILYVGSLIQGKGFVGGLGTMAELPIRQRAPLTISINLLFNDNQRVVENPDLASVTQAVGELISAAHDAGYIAGTSTSCNIKEAHNLNQSMLDIGLSFHYMGFSARTNLGWTSTTETNTIAAVFKQVMFTTSMVLPQMPGDVFSSEFTKELLDEQINMGRIGPDNPPVYVASITWGRMMVFTYTSTSNVDSMYIDINASYNSIAGGGSASVSASSLNRLQSSEINLVAIGGTSASVQGLLSSGNLRDFFSEDVPLTSAVPISYTLKSLSDNSIAKVSETTEYDIEQWNDFEVILYSDFDDWRAAVEEADMPWYQFLTSAQNVYMANEVLTLPGKNEWLGDILTWQADNTGFPFDFYLKSENESPSNDLVYHDTESSGDFPNETISIGDIGNHEDDDFSLGMIGDSPVFGMYLYIGDNKVVTNEVAYIYAAKPDSEEVRIAQFFEPTPPHFGIISNVPLRRIFYDEDTGGDDIYVKDFYFAVRE